MEQAILAVPSRSHDEIISEIMLELGGARGKSLVETEKVTRNGVESFVRRLAALRRKGTRKQRKAEADHARNLLDLLAELKIGLTDPLAPRLNKQIISEMERVHAVVRELCERQMWFRPKGGRDVDHVKRACARGALDLMQRLSRRPISGSAETSFPVIAALLYEAVRGEREANIKRACDHVLRHRR